MSTVTIERTEHKFTWVGRERTVVQVAPSETIAALTDPNGPTGLELQEMAQESWRKGMGVLLQDDTFRDQLGARPLVVGIPRGGSAPAEGIYQELKLAKPDTALVFSNAGEGRDKSKGSLPEALPKDTTSILITDFVVGAGGETVDHLGAVFAQLSEEEIRMVGFLNVAAATFGLGRITEHMGAQYPNLDYMMASMRIYREGEYKGWQEIHGRNVFLVGTGDAGARAQGAEPTESFYSRYKSQVPVRRD